MESEAGVAVILNRAFDSVEQAPEDDDSYSLTPVAIRMDAVYVLRSRPVRCSTGTGPIYAKVRPLTIDVAGGSFTFEYVENPNCGDRDLVPAED